MATMLPYMHARGPQYWIEDHDDTLDSDLIPHSAASQYPDYLVSGGAAEPVDS